ncbi:PAS domain-containing protein, partial [bacterium]|nr:PAS domain-containing protein [bacterium]
MSNGTKTKIKTTVNLDLVLTNVPTPMFVTDENLKVTQISNAALKALGYRRKDVVGKMSCKVLCNTPVCGTNQCTLKRCFSTGENVIADTIAKTSDGKEIPVTAYCSAIFDEDDNIIGGMEVIVDRTADVAAISEINSLIKASEAGQLDQRADVSKATGNYVDLFSGINGMLDAIIAPLNVSAEYIERISQGDIPELITDEYKGDFNEIKNNLNKCIQSLNDLTSEMGTLAGAAVEGKLDTRGDVTKFNGEYATIVKGVNDTLDNVIGPLNVSAEYIERISQGDIPEKITDEYKGDFNEIKNNLNKCIQSLNDLTAEMGMLAGAAVEGKLDTRGDVTKFNGKYATIVNGVNDTLDN